MNKILERVEGLCWSDAMREVLSALFKGNLFPAARVSGCAQHSLFRQLCQELLCTWIFWKTTKNLLCSCWNLGKIMAGNVLKGPNPFWAFQNVFFFIIITVSCWLSIAWTTECSGCVNFNSGFLVCDPRVRICPDSSSRDGCLFHPVPEQVFDMQC